MYRFDNMRSVFFSFIVMILSSKSNDLDVKSFLHIHAQQIAQENNSDTTYTESSDAYDESDDSYVTQNLLSPMDDDSYDCIDYIYCVVCNIL